MGEGCSSVSEVFLFGQSLLLLLLGGMPSACLMEVSRRPKQNCGRGSRKEWTEGEERQVCGGDPGPWEMSALSGTIYASERPAELPQNDIGTPIADRCVAASKATASAALAVCIIKPCSMQFGEFLLEIEEN